MTMDSAAKIEAKHALITKVRGEIQKEIIGQAKMIDRLLIGLFTKGHVLIEGVPGLAKTTAVKALAATISADFKRVQFTPDLLPADIVGTEIFQPKQGEFTVKKGPVFNNIVLADEINRAPSKVQSALLEAMQERQVTIGDETFTLPNPFLVLATQNPIEQEGTYPLPEAQVDRFMLKLDIGYPARDEEKEIIRRMGTAHSQKVESVLGPSDIAEIGQVIDEVALDERLLDYIVDLVRATRSPEDFKMDIGPYVQFGASPRAGLFLASASRAYAFLQGRSFVTPQDIKTIAPDVLRHRILLSYEAEAEEITSEDIISRIFEAVEVP